MWPTTRLPASDFFAVSCRLFFSECVRAYRFAGPSMSLFRDVNPYQWQIQAHAKRTLFTSHATIRICPVRWSRIFCACNSLTDRFDGLGQRKNVPMKLECISIETDLKTSKSAEKDYTWTFKQSFRSESSLGNVVPFTSSRYDKPLKRRVPSNAMVWTVNKARSVNEDFTIADWTLST